VSDNRSVSDRSALDQEDATAAKEAWEKPSITSHIPANAAEGISYNPLDGISNLTV
jgi:hypothetical protein